ncbi:MAG: CysS/YqeB C-terminal domain-containing protein [Pikeienuella sp.]
MVRNLDITALRSFVTVADIGKVTAAAARLKASAALLGLLEGRQEAGKTLPDGLSEAEIAQQIEARNQARKAGDFAAADAIRDALAEKGIELTDSPQGTGWRNRRK